MDRYHIQKDGEVVDWPEKKLRRKLRGNDLTGLELVRHEDDEQWRPLHDLHIYREEVPHVGDPRDNARRSMARGFGVHLVIYSAITFFVLGGPLSIPGIIWGLFLLGHAAKALPVTWSLVREGKLLPSGGSRATLPAGGREGKALPAPAEAAPTGVLADLAEVRALLERRPDADRSFDDVLGRMEASVTELDERITALSNLLAEEDAASLAERYEQAQRALAEATLPEDRALRQRQIEVIEERRGADRRARKTLDRLQLRRDLAEQQVRQLRIDLVRAEAAEVEPEQLDRRLEQIRLEAEAAEEVEEFLGQDPTRTSSS